MQVKDKREIGHILFFERMKNLIRTTYTAIGVVLSAIATVPALLTMKRKKKTYTKELFDKEVYKTSSVFGKRMFKFSGSTIEVKGLENIPDGAVLFASNHQSNFDIAVLLGYLQKPIGFISKIEVKKVPIAREWIYYMNGVFLDRSDRRKSVKTIQEGIQKLKDGHSIVIFPEGTRSKSNQVGEFKSGALRLGAKALVPIVPVAIEGTYNILEANGNRIKPAHVVLEVLPPIYPEQYEQVQLSEISEQIKENIQKTIDKNTKLY